MSRCDTRKYVGTFSLEGRQVVCGTLVKDGKAIWLDQTQTVCLVTVQTLQQWADKIDSVVKTRFTTNIMTVDEIYSGEDARGTGSLLMTRYLSRCRCT